MSFRWVFFDDFRHCNVSPSEGKCLRRSVNSSTTALSVWKLPQVLQQQETYKSSKLRSSQLWTQFRQLRIDAWKSQDFNGIGTRDLAIPVRRSNQLSNEATDDESWSFVSSNEPVKNDYEVIYEMFYILNFICSTESSLLAINHIYLPNLVFISVS